MPSEVAVESLMDVATGVYRVSTHSAAYEMDLIRMVLLYIPHSADVAGSLRRDDVFVKLLGIHECTLG